MSAAARSGSDDALLLAASLLPGARAAESWRAWCDRHSFDSHRFRGGTYDLLPLVSVNLERAGHQDASSARLKGLRRRAWTLSQSREVAIARWTERMASAGISCVAMGDAPLARFDYTEPGARLIRSAALLIAHADAPRAHALACAEGATPQFAAGRLRPDLLSVAPTLRYSLPDGTVFELKLRPWPPVFDMRAAEAVRRDAVPMGAAAAAGRADRLLSACINVSWRADAETAIDAADVVICARAMREDEWEHLVARCRDFHLGGLTLGALDAVEEFEPGVPTWVREALSRAVGPVAPISRPGLLAKLSGRWREWRALSGVAPPDGPPAAPRDFPNYLRCVYGLDSVRALPPAAVRSLARRRAFRAGGEAAHGS